MSGTYIKLKSGQFVTVDEFNDDTETYIRLWLDSAPQDEIMTLISTWLECVEPTTEKIMTLISATYATEDERREEHYRNLADDNYGM
ncbi:MULTISPECIES: hypothetical protein [unclassified Enterococcus]|uniref:hypothetical protein n=1 Tax=unclassified Enterococcus TaxID=2608891 RepID=UPI001553FBA1|nr:MULTISPECIES: hypothetical protein [unclassified Enterococcus]MBS7578323.1 hypothetical protein [Enterococcus sp. MMGLQ5-2]MBS7585466.1 hypothetical protein [Enterococcus sp. MMGLQ5-1]NPD13323.1 hypothetical protein [Enterococcus sp. MMGLQ5-1]NPD38154.1 hypothetical protein [Enterococcus sp. MMGLQ5-2]